MAVFFPVPCVPVDAMPASRTFSSTTFQGMHKPKRASSRFSWRLVTPASTHTAGFAGSDRSTVTPSSRSQKMSVSSDGTSADHEKPDATTRTRCPRSRASATASTRSSIVCGVHTCCALHDAMRAQFDHGTHARVRSSARSARSICAFNRGR